MDHGSESKQHTMQPKKRSMGRWVRGCSVVVVVVVVVVVADFVAWPFGCVPIFFFGWEMGALGWSEDWAMGQRKKIDRKSVV